MDIPNMPAQAVQISLDRDLLRRVDADPETKDVGRSGFIRSAILLYLKAKERREIDRAILSAYSGHGEELLAEIEDLPDVQAWPK
jgi:metal-responsive CopG/Arc/MetJ family transcriptional regulator